MRWWLCSDPVQHLVLVVHGIGLHKDFTDGEFEEDGGGAETKGISQALDWLAVSGALTSLRHSFAEVTESCVDIGQLNCGCNLLAG